SEALLSIAQSMLLTSTSDHGAGLGLQSASADARFLIEWTVHVGWYSRIAFRAVRRPPCAQADRRIWSNSDVQQQGLPLGRPNFSPLMGPPLMRNMGSGVDAARELARAHNKASRRNAVVSSSEPCTEPHPCRPWGRSP